MRARRGLMGIGVFMSALASVTGCTGFMNACPAIGYSSVVSITLEDPRQGLTLEVCGGEGCIVGPPLEPVRIGGELEQRESDAAEVSGSSLDGWHVMFMSGGESVLGYRLTDEAGAVVGEGHVSLEWVRIDGTERCGGNQHAEVELPS